MVSSDRARGSGHIFIHMKFCLNIRKQVFLLCGWCGGELNSPTIETKSLLLKFLRFLMNTDGSMGFGGLS